MGKIAPKACLVAIRHHPVNRYAPHAEHVGFVAYAACETASLHWALWFVASYLLATGFWVIISADAVQDWLGA